MNKHEGCVRGFTQLSRAWYGNIQHHTIGVSDQIMVGFYHPNGGTSGEFSITWESLMGDYVPKLCAYDDSWNVLSLFSDLIERMSEVDNQNISPDEFVKILISLGIEDRTEETI